jgi:hypothetical protein
MREGARATRNPLAYNCLPSKCYPVAQPFQQLPPDKTLQAARNEACSDSMWPGDNHLQRLRSLQLFRSLQLPRYVLYANGLINSGM